MRATVYYKNNCPYCVHAKTLLTKHNIEYDELNAVEHMDDLVHLVTEASGSRPKSVPQIFLDGRYVGGFDQLKIELEG